MKKKILFIIVMVIIPVQSLIEDSVSYRTSISGAYNCKLSCEKKLSDGDTCYLIIIIQGFENSRTDTSFWLEIKPEKGLELVNDADSLIQIFNPDKFNDYFYGPDKIRIKVRILGKKYHSVKTSLIYHGKELAYCFAHGKSTPRRKTYKVK